MNGEVISFYEKNKHAVIKTMWELSAQQFLEKQTSTTGRNVEDIGIAKPPKVINISHIKDQWKRTDFVKRNVYIGRRNDDTGKMSSKLENPFKLENRARSDCLRLYKEWILRKIIEGPTTYNLKELSGKTLCCWCHPEPGHGHVLQEVYNAVFHESVFLIGTVQTSMAGKNIHKAKIETSDTEKEANENTELKTELEKLRMKLRNQKKSKKNYQKAYLKYKHESCHNIFAHFPKDPNCEICNSCKVQHQSIHTVGKDEKEKPCHL